MRSISGFNSDSLQGSFAPGESISASALNKLASAADAARTMMSNDVTFSGGTGGVSYGLPQDVVETLTSTPTYTPFQIVVHKDPATNELRLQIVKGTCLWDGKCLNQEFITTVDPRSPLVIVDGEDPSSPFMDNGGWCVIDDQKWNVYLFNIKSKDSESNILYEQLIFVCTDEYFTNSCPVQLPVEIDDPDVLEAQVIKIGEYQDPAAVVQMAEGVLPFKEFSKAPLQLEIYVKEKYVDSELVKTMYVAPGDVVYQSGGCVTQTTITSIDSRSPVTLTEDGGIVLGEGVIEFYVFLIKNNPASGPETTSVVLYATGDPYSPACPVVLPSEIVPESGTYTAQLIRLGFCGGPYPVPRQYAVGTLTFPGSEGGASHPFKVLFQGTTDGESSYTVVTGAVNNAIPVNMTDTLTVTGAGYVWLEVPYDRTNKTFPKSTDVIIAAGTTAPTSDGDYSYVVLASVDGGTVNQLITGSLWGDRIQIKAGMDETAQYFYAKV